MAPMKCKGDGFSAPEGDKQKCVRKAVEIEKISNFKNGGFLEISHLESTEVSENEP